MISIMPIMPFTGVLISCEILAITLSLLASASFKFRLFFCIVVSLMITDTTSLSSQSIQINDIPTCMILVSSSLSQPDNSTFETTFPLESMVLMILLRELYSEIFCLILKIQLVSPRSVSSIISKRSIMLEASVSSITSSMFWFWKTNYSDLSIIATYSGK